jgi:hypothetical protein
MANPSCGRHLPIDDLGSVDMRVMLCSVVAGLAIASCAFVSAGSAHEQSSPVRLLVNANDRFDVVGLSVACRVFQRSAGFTNRLVCFRETKPQSYRPLAGSYEVGFAEGGVTVARAGAKRSVFARTQLPPPGVAAGSARATAVLGGAARLTGRQDKAFVAGTNIVCRPYVNTSSRAILCVLLGSDGHIHDGTYLVWISDRGVLLAQAQHGKAVTVFQRVHGH